MDNQIHGGNWFFDTLNAWRVLDTVDLPSIERAMSSFAPGGHMMSASFPEEMKDLMARIKLRGYSPDVHGLVGREPGQYTTCTWYENLVSFRNGEAKGRIVSMKGLVNAVKPDRRQGLKKTGTEYDFSSIVLYTDSYDGRIIHKFDFFAGPGATIVNGNQIFATMAANLAIGSGTVL